LKKSLKKNNECEVWRSSWFRYNQSLIYEVRANRFLHNMVRRMVGSMLAYEDSKISLTQFKRFINNKDDVKFNVPANGLVLTEVNYRRGKR